MKCPQQALRNPLFWGITLVLCVGSTALAVPFGFDNITGNSLTDAAIGEAQLSVDVTDAGGGQVLFTFRNSGPEASSITDVYFDDGTLLGIASITNGTGVDYSQGASPGNLPGGNNADPDFVATAGFTADSNPPTQPNGVNPGEELGVLFNIISGQTFADVLAALALPGDVTGSLRIGIHVQGFSSGGSESFINLPPDRVNPVPEPATLMLLGVGLMGLAGYGRKKLN